MDPVDAVGQQGASLAASSIAGGVPALEEGVVVVERADLRRRRRAPAARGRGRPGCTTGPPCRRRCWLPSLSQTIAALGAGDDPGALGGELVVRGERVQMMAGIERLPAARRFGGGHAAFASRSVAALRSRSAGGLPKVAHDIALSPRDMRAGTLYPGAATRRGARAMPLYTYQCDQHGEFSAWGQMSQSEAPQPCPDCERPAPRALAHPAVGSRASAARPCPAARVACAADGPSFGGHRCGARLRPLSGGTSVVHQGGCRCGAVRFVAERAVPTGSPTATARAVVARPARRSRPMPAFPTAAVRFPGGPPTEFASCTGSAPGLSAAAAAARSASPANAGRGRSTCISAPSMTAPTSRRQSRPSPRSGCPGCI